MPKATTVSREIIIDAAFEIACQEGFASLSARNISKKIGCSTQPIYWVYKNMEDLKREVCNKAMQYLSNIIHRYQKTGKPFLDFGLGYVYAASKEPILFKAFYIDNIMNIKMSDILPDQTLLEVIYNDESCAGLSVEEVMDVAAKGWMLAHGIASLIATGMLVYDEKKVEHILNSL